jgi:ABC-type multidrug transport system fused ATPase/permease subunit
MDISHSEKSDLSDEVVISNVNRIEVDKVSITSDKTNIYYPNIQINKGEKIHLKGVSGRGKSLLAKCLLGLIDYLGDIRINGKIMSNHDLIALRKSITYVSQDPFIY